MTTRRQSGRLAPSHPLWLRLVAVFCVVMAAAIGTAQAVHIHGDWLPKKAAHASMPAAASQGQGEEHCPLCVGMYSVMPATMQVVTAPVLEIQLQLIGDVLVAQQRLEHFANFSRPPPAAVFATAAAV